MKLKAHFPHLICVLLSFPCWCMNKGIWPLCHLIFIPVKQEGMHYHLKVRKHSDQLKKVKILMGKMFQLHFVHENF